MEKHMNSDFLRQQQISENLPPLRHWITAGSSIFLAATLTRALRVRNEREYVPAQYGVLRPERLWKLGKDFAYIKNIANFSNVVGSYLKKQLEEE